MKQLQKLLSDLSWDYEEQYMDGSDLGYAERIYVGDVDFQQAEKELNDYASLAAAAREANNRLRMFKLLSKNRVDSDGVICVDAKVLWEESDEQAYTKLAALLAQDKSLT